MSSRVPTVGEIIIHGLKSTRNYTLPGGQNFGPAGMYLNRFSRLNPVSPGTLKPAQFSRLRVKAGRTISGNPYARDVSKREDRLELLGTPFPLPDDFEGGYKLNIGENMSYSKEVLKEFQAREGGGGGGVFRIGGFRPGTSVGAGRVPFTGKNINPNVRMGLNYLYKNLGGVAGVMGKPPQTPGGGGGSGGGSGKFNILWKIAQVLSIPLSFLAGKIAGGIAGVITIYEILKRIYNKAIDSLPLSEENKKWLKANMGIVIGAIAITAGSIEAARRVTPRIMKVLRNRRIAAEIGEALDAGDETLARTILLDAIEDENINLSAIRRKLGDDDYERLYRDYL